MQIMTMQKHDTNGACIDRTEGRKHENSKNRLSQQEVQHSAFLEGLR
jgi:hypothetical protein